jgi:hypothetical protein
LSWEEGVNQGSDAEENGGANEPSQKRVDAGCGILEFCKALEAIFVNGVVRVFLEGSFPEAAGVWKTPLLGCYASQQIEVARGLGGVAVW